MIESCEVARADAEASLMSRAIQSRTVSKIRILTKVVDFESVAATLIDCCADGTQ
jgi:hypothetical protein